MPPLRERVGGADRAGARHAAQVQRTCTARPKRGFTEDATAALEAYSWPGNVRELENRVKTAMIMAETPLITAEDLGLKEGSESALLFNLKEVRTRAERQAIRQALSITDGNVSRTAELLGVSRPTLYDLMDKYGIRAPRDRRRDAQRRVVAAARPASRVDWQSWFAPAVLAGIVLATGALYWPSTQSLLHEWFDVPPARTVTDRCIVLIAVWLAHPRGARGGGAGRSRRAHPGLAGVAGRARALPG